MTTPIIERASIAGAGEHPGVRGELAGRRGASAEELARDVAEVGAEEQAARARTPAPLGAPVPVARGFGFGTNQRWIAMLDAPGRGEVEAERLGDVYEALAAGGEAQPPFVIAGGDERRIEAAVALVQRAAPHRLRADEGSAEEAAAVEVGLAKEDE